MSIGVTCGMQVTANVSMSLELDGYIDAKIRLSIFSCATSSESKCVLNLADIVISQTLSNQQGLMWMGLDGKAEPITGNVTNKHWKWSQTKRSSAVWVGSAEAGLRFHLKGADKDWDSPSVELMLLCQPPLNGEGHHAGAGGCNATANPRTSEVTLAAYTGATSLKNADDSLSLHFDMSITPFKTANQSQHWSLRHFQVGYPSSKFTSAVDVKAAGANVINIHQGVQTMINPYINYVSHISEQADAVPAHAGPVS